MIPDESDHATARRAVARLARLLACAIVAVAATVSALLTSESVAPAPARAASTVPSTIALVSQTPWVRNTRGMKLQVAIRSQIAAAKLGLEVTLYSQATQRGFFEQSLSGNTAGFSVLDSPGLFPLTTKGVLQPNGNALIDLPVASPALSGKAVKAPTNGAVLDLPCDIQCAGVYPLQVSLVDLQTHTPLDSFMTYLILAPQQAVSPLRFSWVLPIGTSPPSSPSGNPAIPPADEVELEQLAAALSANPKASVSLALYPQLARALAAAAGANHAKTKAQARSSGAHTALAALRQIAGMPNAEVEQSTYSPVDMSAVAGGHLVGLAKDQLALGRSTLKSFGFNVATAPYVSPTPLGPLGLGLLTRNGITQLEVPSNSVTAIPPSWDYPVWAPFKVKGTNVTVDASDYYLERHLQSRTDPVLRANQLLADLAILYFVEQPPGNRGVTLLAPLGWHTSPQFLFTLMSGLNSSPIVDAVTLSHFFQQVPAGSEEIPVGHKVSPLLYRGLTAGSIPSSDQLPGAAITTARHDLRALSALLPNDPLLILKLQLLVLIGESAGLSSSERLGYLNVPAAQLQTEASQLSLLAKRTITITSLSAKVPISIYSRAKTPLAVDLRLSGCPSPTALAGCRASDLSFRRPVQPLLLQPGNTTVEVQVSTKSSGDFILHLHLTTPGGGVTLSSNKLTIRSTAISSVAIVLTAAAGAFLLVWWARSAVKRRRRGKHMRTEGGPVGDRDVVAPSSTT
ncbi:MAG: DUF6049 family protein [Acidimicrobiales bacterium]